MVKKDRKWGSNCLNIRPIIIKYKKLCILITNAPIRETLAYYFLKNVLAF